MGDVTIFLSPHLPDDQMRVVLNWQSSQDLNLYAVQIDTSTGDIYCKSGTETRMPMKACDGVMMDMDSRNGKENAETMTWYLGSDDPHTYLLYVQDSDQKELTGSEAEIMFYGGDNVHGLMFVEDNDFDARFWMLGLFTPSEGLSTFDPDCALSFDHEPELHAKVCGSNGRTYSSEWQLTYETCCRRGGGNCGGYWSFKNVLAYKLAKFG